MRDLGNKQVFARNLRNLMTDRNVKAKDLSNAIECPYTTLLSWLKADNYPRIDKIEALADYFGVMKSDLIEDKKIPTEEEGFLDGDTERMRSLIKRIRTCSPEELDRMEQILRIVQGE